jgi:RNA polymerase sigma-70 factor (ECF subfamily)
MARGISDSARPTGAFPTWLFAIATNLVRQHFRWLKRHPTVSMDSADPLADERPLGEQHPAEPTNPVEADERARSVRRAISALPQDLREAVLLFEYEDLSYEEIAKIAGCSRKAVETRLYRARAILREKLQNWLDPQ